MSPVYRVAPGKCVCLPSKANHSRAEGRMIKAGEVLPSGALKHDEIKRHIASGYLIEEGMTRPEFVEQPVVISGSDVVMPQGSEDSTPRILTPPASNNISPDPVPTVETVETPSESSEEVNSVDPSGDPKSIWNFDPASLEGKSVEDLQVLVAETDPNMDAEALASAQELIEWLTQDFEG